MKNLASSRFALFSAFPKLHSRVLPFLVLFIFCAASSYGQWTSTNLSQAKVQMGAVASGSKAYFGGGSLGFNYTNVAEIYDIETNTWTTGTLSAARAFPGAAANGGKVFFAGGVNWTTLAHYANVDIYDTLTQSWSTASLSVPRAYAQGVSVGNKVLFAGGYKVLGFNPTALTFYSTVDVYDTGSGTWSVLNLSKARGSMGVAVADDLVFFAGGQTSVSAVTDQVDIYNNTTGTWSTAKLSEPRGFCAAARAGKYVLIAGGVKNDNTPSDRVDIYNLETGAWSTASLSEPRCFSTMGASACGKAFFAGGGALDLPTFLFESFSKQVDIFDAATGQWSTDNLSKAVTNHSVLGLKNHVLAAGGINGNVTYKSVDIFTCQSVGINEATGAGAFLEVFPNPVSENLFLTIDPKFGNSGCTVECTDWSGRLVAQFECPAGSTTAINVAGWRAGMYWIKVSGNNHIATGRFVKME
ncbi:MAG: T9SS type A sorting domain-containing protein [Saprospirales bacterium]|nr:T9SS type A sorting domain-containing protein [Saprospirales bacterium]